MVGEKLGIKPFAMVVPAALEDAALHILSATNDAARASNVGANTAALIDTPFAG